MRQKVNDLWFNLLSFETSDFLAHLKRRTFSRKQIRQSVNTNFHHAFKYGSYTIRLQSDSGSRIISCIIWKAHFQNNCYLRTMDQQVPQYCCALTSFSHNLFHQHHTKMKMDELSTTKRTQSSSHSGKNTLMVYRAGH